MQIRDKFCIGKEYLKTTGYQKKFIIMIFDCVHLFTLGLEGLGACDEIRDRRSDFENSEEERRRSRICNLKKKAINASSKFTHSLKKRGKRKIDYRVPSVSIEDVRDEKEESAVQELRQRLLDMDLLPARHDDYHTLLRSANASIYLCFINIVTNYQLKIQIY